MSYIGEINNLIVRFKKDKYKDGYKESIDTFLSIRGLDRYSFDPVDDETELEYSTLTALKPVGDIATEAIRKFKIKYEYNGSSDKPDVSEDTFSYNQITLVA